MGDNQRSGGSSAVMGRSGTYPGHPARNFSRVVDLPTPTDPSAALAQDEVLSHPLTTSSLSLLVLPFSPVNKYPFNVCIHHFLSDVTP